MTIFVLANDFRWGPRVLRAGTKLDSTGFPIADLEGAGAILINYTALSPADQGSVDQAIRNQDTQRVLGGTAATDASILGRFVQLGIVSPGGLGTGDVVGPNGGVVNTELAAYAGTTGKQIQSTGVTAAAGAVAATTYNGVALTTAGSAANSLREDGTYAPAGSPTSLTAAAAVAVNALVKGSDGTRGMVATGISVSAGNDVTGATYNGIALLTGGAGSLYLDDQGNYTSPSPLPTVDTFADNTTYDLTVGDITTDNFVRVAVSIIIPTLANATAGFELVLVTDGVGLTEDILKVDGPTPLSTLVLSTVLVGNSMTVRLTGSGAGDKAKITSRVLDTFAQ